MKPFPWLTGALAVLTVVSQPPLFGQVYAPDTEFHDPSQRLFVVEAARVLAWRENRKELKVHQITYKTSIGDDRKTSWQLDWLDDHGKSIRHFEVSYPESLLAGGPRFYREVFVQLCGKDPSPAVTLAEQDMSKRFWEAAESAGLSRTEGLRAAFKLTPTEPSLPEQELAPRLAGVLSHTTLPSLGGTVSMDVALLARSAAWLCLAENMVKDRGAASDALWAPILFLAGRENAASDLWKNSVATAGGRLAAGNAPAAWDFFLRRPKAHEAFAFAARPQNRQFAMPVMIYYSLLLQISSTLAEVAPQIFGEDEQGLGRLHDFSAFMSCEAGVGGGHILGGRWPVLARQAWIGLLNEFKPAAPDYTGHADTLKQATQDFNAALANRDIDRDTDASLTGYKAAAPLIEQGYRAGVGQLVPVATATARDLLNFGWEMTGLQMGERYRFVQHLWGVPERGKPIIEIAQHEVSGLDPFFDDKSPGQVKNWLKQYDRLQFVYQFGPKNTRLWQFSVWDKTSRAANARLYVRRCWLGTGHPLHQVWSLVRADAWEDIGPVMQRYRAEGGPRHDYKLLYFIMRWLKSGEAKKIEGCEQLRRELSQSLPDVSTLQIEAAAPRSEKLPSFEHAQQMERAFWQRPEMHVFTMIFDEYLRAHAYQSAKRFYDQAEPIITERVLFSNSFGPKRYTLAMLENDRPAMQAALRASSTYSARDLILEMVDCAAREDWAALEKLIADTEERYESFKRPGSSTQRLKGFLPLIPALKDPKHPDHDKALDYFVRSNQWTTLQWLFITKYKLSTEDAVRFLGSLETDPERRLMARYLLKDAPGFEETYNDFRKAKHKWSNMGFVLVYYLRNELLQVPVPAQQPDLKPAVTQTIAEAVAAELAKTAPPPEDLSKFTTADALWEHLEQLKRGPPRRPHSAAEMRTVYSGFLKTMQDAAEEFCKRYPADSRRWDAKLLQLQTAATVGAMGNKPIQPAVFESAIQEVAAARDASSSAKANADYLLVSFHAQSLGESVQSQAFETLTTEILAFEKKHPGDPRNGPLLLLRLKITEMQDPAKAQALLDELAKSRYPEVARAAQQRIQLRAMLQKPLELKFTATDGAVVDLMALRGKVVLLDFWATWCEPCLAETPKIVELYKKFHEKGFEIIGISLDQDQERMASVARKRGMVWPQCFDGKGRGNELAVKFDVQSLPAKWLVDKKGMAHATDAREGLQQQVEKLLAE